MRIVLDSCLQPIDEVAIGNQKVKALRAAGVRQNSSNGTGRTVQALPRCESKTEEFGPIAFGHRDVMIPAISHGGCIHWSPRLVD
jgi:hypothetical protein